MNKISHPVTLNVYNSLKHDGTCSAKTENTYSPDGNNKKKTSMKTSHLLVLQYISTFLDGDVPPTNINDG